MRFKMQAQLTLEQRGSIYTWIFFSIKIQSALCVSTFCICGFNHLWVFDLWLGVPGRGGLNVCIILGRFI